MPASYQSLFCIRKAASELWANKDSVRDEHEMDLSWTAVQLVM